MTLQAKKIALTLLHLSLYNSPPPGGRQEKLQKNQKTLIEKQSKNPAFSITWSQTNVLEYFVPAVHSPPGQIGRRRQCVLRLSLCPSIRPSVRVKKL